MWYNGEITKWKREMKREKAYKLLAIQERISNRAAKDFGKGLYY